MRCSLRRTWIHARWLALVVAVGFAPASVAVADDAAQARFHDEAARRHYDAGRYEEALREFFAVQRLSPNPRVVFNIAVCFDQLDRDDDAFLFFSEYVDGDDDDDERRAFATRALARLSERVARVRITSDPPGADVYVDRRDHGSYGQTPRLLALEPGEHTIEVERPGYRSFEATVTVERGHEARVEATLERVLGRVVVVGEATAGQLRLRDEAGAVVHEGPSGEPAVVPPGSYTIELRAAGYLPWRSVARVEGDEETVLRPTLTARPPPTGALTVTSNTSGALLSIDGERSGFVPATFAELGVGTHRVRLEHDGLQPWEDEVEIRADERAWLTVTLSEPERVERSEWTWVTGGLGAGALVAGAITAGVAVDVHDRYQAELATADPAGANALRDQGVSLNLAADVLLVTGAVALAAAVVLFFVTESRTEGRSDATTAREAR